jgi:hypothetical protein
MRTFRGNEGANMHVTPAREALTLPALSDGEMRYVVERLLADRRVSMREVRRYAENMHEEIAALEERLWELRREARGEGSRSVRGPGVRR